MARYQADAALLARLARLEQQTRVNALAITEVEGGTSGSGSGAIWDGGDRISGLGVFDGGERV